MDHHVSGPFYFFYTGALSKIVIIESVADSRSQFSGIHLLTKQNMIFDSDPAVYAGTPVPTLDDWKSLWETWDTVTRGMIPDEELLEKPIKLRNACIFYLGHIPTFMDIQLTKTTKLPPCEPSYYSQIFERGIDPDVDNPEHCHAHSEIPDEWPPLQEILAYQDQVRAKVERLIKGQDIPRHIGRALWIGFEHEIMHLETLLYMLLQSDKTLPQLSSFRILKEMRSMLSLQEFQMSGSRSQSKESQLGLMTQKTTLVPIITSDGKLCFGLQKCHLSDSNDYQGQ